MLHRSAAIPLAHNLTLEYELTGEGKKRIDKAVEIAEKHNFDYVIMNSGACVLTDSVGTRRITNPKICEVMRDYALDLGFPEHRILIEPYSWDTTGEAYFIKEMVMDRHDIKSIVVVTSDYHLNRSMIIFRKTLGPGYIVEGVGVGTGLENDPNLVAHEKDSLEKFLNQFGSMHPGHSKIVEEGLYESHPIYSDTQKIPEMDRLRFY